CDTDRWQVNRIGLYGSFGEWSMSFRMSTMGSTAD
ncbi:hypothetical protein ABIB57_000903, partial [Devosia sp. UYZn731]